LKILIAVDASSHSERAMDFVTRMRWPAGSRVIVVSALQPVPAPAGAPPLNSDGADLIEARRKDLEEMVSRAEATLREAGFPTEGRVLIGDPRQALVEVAERERADLLVVGSRGRTGISRLMLGSVSSHVVAHAPCSVLVVKQPGRAESHPPRKEAHP
jgi:nucleotide-binding universal stress UspA family protein